MKDKKSLDIAEKIKNETFDMDPEEIRKLGYHAVDLIVDYFSNISQSPILPNITLEEIKGQINELLPQIKQDPSIVLDDCQEKIIKNAVHIGSPRFLGWVLASVTPIGAFADGIAGALNQNVAVSGVGMATAVELLVIDWIKEIIGYDPQAGGILVSGGSIANLTALAIARNIKADYDVKKVGMQKGNNIRLYVSREVHMCIPKAANLLGIGTNNIRWVDVDDKYCMDVDDLEKKILEDKKNGCNPFSVVATAGTANTGAIDPLNSIADICQKHDLWFHVDAAYGGFATLSSEHKSLLNGIDRADSVVLDPHKWLFIPFEAGCVLVKKPSFMSQTFAMDADYIHLDNDRISKKEDIDFSDYGLQLSRGFRALKIWMSLKQYGVKKYARIIDQNIYLAQYLEEILSESNDFEIVAPMSLSVVCFRYVPRDLKMEKSNDDQRKIEMYLSKLNLGILNAMRKDGRALLSSTLLDKKYVLRACIVNFRTTKQDIKDIVDIIRKLGEVEDQKIRNRYL